MSNEQFKGHTPGPFFKTPYIDRGFLIVANNIPLAHVKKANGMKEGEDEANATLFAAAPSLLSENISLKSKLDEAYRVLGELVDSYKQVVEQVVLSSPKSSMAYINAFNLLNNRK